MGYIALRERGQLWNPQPHDLKYMQFWTVNICALLGKVMLPACHEVE